MGFLEGLKLFFEGAFDFKKKNIALLEDQYQIELEEFMILCFSDLLGIDLPTGYYALEIYPHLIHEVDRWQRNSHDRKSVWEARGQSLEMDP